MIQEFGVDAPISIFAMFVFLSRKGYLSYNKKFMYDTDMKDFALLGGVDVVRGTGVCRSISAMLNDVYKDFGFNSHCLGTSAKDSSFVRGLSEVKLTESSAGKSFVDVVLPITSLVRSPNHMVTAVSDGKFNHVFDATNNNIFYVNGHKLINMASDKAVMYRSVFSGGLMGIVGNYDTSFNPIKDYKQYKLPHITYEEYKNSYLEAVSLLKNNLDIVESFYEQSNPLYKDIVMISNEQKDLFHRLMPFIPVGKEKKNVKIK